MTNAPILETARLILRPHSLADYASCRTLWADERVVKHIGGAPQDGQAVWFRLLRYAGMWSLLGYGMWAIEDRKSGDSDSKCFVGIRDSGCRFRCRQWIT